MFRNGLWPTGLGLGLYRLLDIRTLPPRVIVSGKGSFALLILGIIAGRVNSAASSTSIGTRPVSPLPWTL